MKSQYMKNAFFVGCTVALIWFYPVDCEGCGSVVEQEQLLGGEACPFCRLVIA